MNSEHRMYFLDNLRTFLIFLVVLVHAGVVYESSGFMAPYWLVDDPTTSDLPGLVNLILEIFVMPVFFFISGYLNRPSLAKKGAWRFLKNKFRRLMVPWFIAVLTLIPFYNAIFLWSRGLPREGWQHYFHFTNGHISMSWLWFLPVLFFFDCLYVVVSRLDLPKIRLGTAVTVVFAVGFAYTVMMSTLEWIGWTKTPVVDFQNEKLVPYFLVFLLGSLCHRLGIFDNDTRNMKLYIGINATVWIPMNVYVIVLLNFFLRPGQYIISGTADMLLLWFAFHLSVLSLLYCAVMTFKYFFNRQRPFGRVLSRLSYPVYIIHVAVLGPIAMALLAIDIPALLKYPILAVATYVTSNVLAYVYVRSATALRAPKA